MAIKPIQMLCASSKYNIKCPYQMTATRIVVHNTANDASARNEIQYMINNNDECSFHFAIDDKEVVQGIPLNRNAWHAGDGSNGAGNRKGIGIEICYSKSGGSKFTASEKLAAKFIAQLLKERGWSINKVTKHQDYSGKYCPHRTLDLGWQRFLNMIKSELNKNSSTSTDSNATTSASSNKSLDIIYRVKTLNHGWLGEVKNLTDYAGWQDSPIVAIAMKATSGIIKYQVHVKGGGWLGIIKGYDINNYDTGYAGNGKPIDAIKIVYEGGKAAKYRVAPVGGNYYDWQKDTQKTGGQDGYAGCFGQAIGKLQIDIV